MHKPNFARFLSVRVQKTYLTAILPAINTPRKARRRTLRRRSRTEFRPLFRIFAPYRDFATFARAATHFVSRNDGKDDICSAGIEIITHFSQINYLLSFCRNRRLLPTTACFNFPRQPSTNVLRDLKDLRDPKEKAIPVLGHASPKPKPTAEYRPMSVPPSSRVRGWQAKCPPRQPLRRLHDGELPYS